MVKKSRPVNILLIEDNPGDVRLTKEAFEQVVIAHQLDVVMDGVEAIKFLKKEDNYEHEKTPDLILLDFNLPKKDGREVLQEIKADNRFLHIPVIVLTTSQADSDILKSYNLHANCYVNKPVDYDQFHQVIKRIEEFWMDTVILPTMI